MKPDKCVVGSLSPLAGEVQPKQHVRKLATDRIRRTRRADEASDVEMILSKRNNALGLVAVRQSATVDPTAIPNADKQLLNQAFRAFEEYAHNYYVSPEYNNDIKRVFGGYTLQNHIEFPFSVAKNWGAPLHVGILANIIMHRYFDANKDELRALVDGTKDGIKSLVSLISFACISLASKLDSRNSRITIQNLVNWAGTYVKFNAEAVKNKELEILAKLDWHIFMLPVDGLLNASKSVLHLTDKELNTIQVIVLVGLLFPRCVCHGLVSITKSAMYLILVKKYGMPVTRQIFINLGWDFSALSTCVDDVSEKWNLVFARGRSLQIWSDYMDVFIQFGPIMKGTL